MLEFLINAVVSLHFYGSIILRITSFCRTSKTEAAQEHQISQVSINTRKALTFSVDKKRCCDVEETRILHFRAMTDQRCILNMHSRLTEPCEKGGIK